MRNPPPPLERLLSRTTERRGSNTASGRRPNEDRLAKGLGWFSLGLGLPQVLLPSRVNRLIGIEDNSRNRAIMRAVGLRELGGGAGILDRPRPGGFLFARIAGDLMDLVLLRAAFRPSRKGRRRVAAATAAVAGVAVLDIVASARTSRSSGSTTADGGIRVRTAVTVNRPPDEVYGYWHDFENLPNFMAHLESVEVTGDGRSHWTAKAPAGTKVEWDAEIVEDIPDELIAWRSAEGAHVPNSGCVRFTSAPGDAGTEVTVELEYQPPGGAMGAAFSRLFGEEPLQQIKDDLRRFKQVIETGEVVRSDGTPEGTRTQRQFHQDEAQPVG
ncbi:MAG: SRPBCC family protein [Actinobacteria bacterium]|nr:SRPBCC family protein [Actinomycetota bacterium]MBW3650609.1 SRPBCC family protein [Actinomycetota bacterium]